MTLAAESTTYAGPLGFVIIVILGIVTYLLIRNMDKRLRRLPKDFPEPQARPGRLHDEDRTDRL